MTETKVYCDICKEQIDEKQVERRENKTVKIAIFDSLTCSRTFEKTYDVCEECLDKLEKQFNITSKDYKV